jgi:hypothetical protein
MRRIFAATGTLTVLFVVAGFLVPWLRSDVRDLIQGWKEVGQIAQMKRPAPRLHLRPGDRARFPRTNFGFRFESGHGELVDTFRGLVTKDRVTDPDTTINLVLTSAELDSIYDKMLEIRLFDLPEPHPPYSAGGVLSEPSTHVQLQVRSGELTKALEWDSGRVVGPHWEISDDWKRLGELRDLIRRIVGRRPEYRALPPSRGLYL